MELRQLRYFAKVCELGVVTSALSQQISRLEGELATRLLQRSASGAVRAAQQARLSGHVSAGFSDGNAARVEAMFLDNLARWQAGQPLRNLSQQGGVGAPGGGRKRRVSP